MANTTSDEEIIEKRPSNPVATSCLILAALAMLGAIIYQVAEISEVRATNPVDRESPDQYRRLYEKNKKEFEAGAKKVVDENDHPEITLTAPGGSADAGAAGSDADSGAGGAAPAAAPAAAPEKAPAETPAAEPAAEPAAGDAGAKDAAPEKADEKAAEPPADAGAAEPAPAEPAPAEGGKKDE